MTQPAIWPSLDKYLQSLFVSLVLQQKLQQNVSLVWACRGYYWGCCLTKIQDLTKFASCTLLYVVSQILYLAGTCTCSEGKYYLITIIDNIIPRAWSGYEVMTATFKQTQKDLGRRGNKIPCHPSGVEKGVCHFELFSGLTKPKQRFERTPVLASICTGT